MKQTTLYDLNLRVLRMHYPSAISIIASSPYVVLYSFSESKKTWTKEHCEGTLFIFSTNKGYSYTILNRVSLESFSANLVCPDDLEYSDPYIIHKINNSIDKPIYLKKKTYVLDEIYGLWIWEAFDRQKISSVMINCAKRNVNT
ncbi:hypothetical protein T552_04056 [Pneumocystis carinii B80]|uniref:PH domain-containing protein n=1 Tax=Pneumocystis carinii (strain B80) TaxID=1408658 RepID=A0A0W4ZT36_PNEC8|nr:hypothetical protein T552_04056 [Pneumocystis carinii B80]KTW31543.1 hypothetical protein T552_04056 [Pneumocystis carinii B80]